jgi:hypothetical protein
MIERRCAVACVRSPILWRLIRVIDFSDGTCAIGFKWSKRFWLGQS